MECDAIGWRSAGANSARSIARDARASGRLMPTQPHKPIFFRIRRQRIQHLHLKAPMHAPSAILLSEQSLETRYLYRSLCG